MEISTFKVSLKWNCKIKGKYLNAHYLQIGPADFSQIRMNLIHGHDKPHFQGHIR